MHRRLLSTVTTLLAFAVVVAIPWLGWIEAERQAYFGAAEVATGYAHDILYRADKTVVQARNAMSRLRDANLVPCSPEELSLMGQLDLSSFYIQAVGRMRPNTVLCSSVAGLTLNLGDEIYPTPSGAALYLNVSISKNANESVIALQQGDFVTLINPKLPLDTWTNSRDVSLGIFQIDRPLAVGPEIARGNVKRAWLAQLAGKNATTFVDDNRLIAVVRSAQFRIAATAALPISDLVARRDAIAVRLVPAGAMAGLLMGFAILSFGRRQNSLASALRKALRRQELFMLYQPIVELTSGRCIGVEALLRWRHPNGEMIGPNLFIPVAEQSGLITRITERVFELVRIDAGSWLVSNPQFHIAINLSPTDLYSPTLLTSLDRFMSESGACPANLMLEITERGLVDIGAARQIMHALRARGYDIAIDDFGTGYSSLSYLESLELDILKIDRSFVEAIGTRAPTRPVVNHIIAMARAIGLRVIAEGVERQSQAEYLISHRVEYAQGWLFGQPGSFDTVIALMDAQHNVLAVNSPMVPI